MTSRPEYVELDGGLVFRPPYLQSDAFLTAWILRSDRAAQQRLLDQAFNRPSGGAVDYRPLLGAAILSFANIQRISSLDPVDKNYGYTNEIDTCFWMLAGAYVDDALHHLVWYVPYIWVDNSLALIVGRDVHGFPKQIGWSSLPTSPSDPGPFWTDGLVLANHSAETPVTRGRIFTIERDPAADLGDLRAWDAGDKLAALKAIFEQLRSLGGLEIDLHLIQTVVSDLFGGHLPMLFLKQIRDASSHDRAAYQAIIEAHATVIDFRGAGLLPPGWTLNVNDYASHRVAETLGLGGPQSIDSGFWLKYSFSMDLGKEVWRAP